MCADFPVALSTYVVYTVLIQLVLHSLPTYPLFSQRQQATGYEVLVLGPFPVHQVRAVDGASLLT